MPGKLTTHVLDTAHGCPAANLKLELWTIDPANGPTTLLLTTTTNRDGRTDTPLLSEGTLQIGTYQLIFFVGEYFAQFPDRLPDPPFLNRIPIQFSIANPNAHYHVPLLTSPWSYSTYRGS